MQFNLTICYIRWSSNTIPDSLSRLFQDSSPQERRENESKYMHEVDDFILPVMMRFQNRTSLEPDQQTDWALAADGRGDPAWVRQGWYQVSWHNAVREWWHENAPRCSRYGPARPATAGVQYTATPVACTCTGRRRRGPGPAYDTLLAHDI